jgi:hypothetical protein
VAPLGEREREREREREGARLKAIREKALEQTRDEPSTMANNNSIATRGTQHI